MTYAGTGERNPPLASTPPARFSHTVRKSVMTGYTVFAGSVFVGRFGTIREVLRELDVPHYEVVYANARPCLVIDTENHLVYRLYTVENPYPMFA